MKKRVVGLAALSLAATAFGRRAGAQDTAAIRRDPTVQLHPDPWLGPDKVQHFALSAFITSISYAALTTVRASHRSAVAGAVTGALAVGVGKELFDKRSYGRFSLRDLAWDAVGIVTATAILGNARR